MKPLKRIDFAAVPEERHAGKPVEDIDDDDDDDDDEQGQGEGSTGSSASDSGDAGLPKRDSLERDDAASLQKGRRSALPMLVAHAAGVSGNPKMNGTAATAGTGGAFGRWL